MARHFRAKHSQVVIKPVRYGLVTDEDPPQVAWTSILTDEVLQHWDGSPVLLQQLIRAREHLRIVTVGDDVWACSLVAKELDWREQLENHSAFRAVDRDAYATVLSLSRKIADELRLGYTAQDWIIDEQGKPWFLEANPNGQWLFLDEQLEGGITGSIARHLEESAGSA
ncbi:MAG: hypothetical protein ACR2KQ_11265 [Actinomycetota bacterium]